MRLWDEPSLRTPASPEWNEEGFHLLAGVTVEDVVEIHHQAASHGRTTKAGVRSHPFLEAIWEEYQANVADQIDPLYVATRWVKHLVMHRPFFDANRRTSFSWAATHFRAFGKRIIINTPEAIAYKHRVRNVPFTEVYEWFEKRI